MPVTLDIAVCPETGIASFIVTENGERVKTDLVADEMNEITSMASQNAAGIKACMADIDAEFAKRLSSFSDEELKNHILNPVCNI